MKKLSYIKKNIIVKLAFLACFVATFISCNSVPDNGSTIVHPVDLLDNKSFLYVAVPKSVDPELLKLILASNISGASSGDINQIFSRISTIYAGIGKNMSANDIQAAIDSNIPLSFIPNILSEKNGWESVEYTPESGNRKYTVYSYDGLNLAFPSGNITCIGRNLPEMLEYYDYEHFVPSEEAIGFSFNQIDKLNYEWLKSAEKEIKFYTSYTTEYLAQFIGFPINLNLNDIRGAVVPDSKNDKNYLATFYLDFKNLTSFKAGKLVLSFALGSENLYYDANYPNTIIIKNMVINKNQIYNLFIK